MAGTGFSFTAPYLGMLAASIRRFPLAMLAALAFAAISVLNVHDLLQKLPYRDLILYGLFVSFFAQLATELVAEAKRWNVLKRLFACTLSAAAIASWCLMVGMPFGLPHWLFGLSLFGLCIAAPAFGGASNEDLWYFNNQTFLGLAIAGVASGVVVAGAGIVLYALSSLFGMHNEPEWFMTAAIVAYALFCPAYTMTFMPRLPVVLAAPPVMPAALGFVLTFVALPILLLLGAIIAAYGISVLGLGAAPKTSVSWLIVGFSAAGIALHFMLYPMREGGSRLVCWFERYYYILLLPMLGLLFWAITLRVQEYGLTENRYMALLGGLWAGGLALSASFKKGERGLGNAPAALSLLLVLASLGPWSAERVSFASQSERLSAALTSAGMMRDGAIIVPQEPPALGFEQRGNLSSLLEYFHERRDGQKPAYLLPFASVDMMGADSWADAVMRRWQLNYVPRWERNREQENARETYFSATDGYMLENAATPVSIEGYSWIQSFNIYRSINAVQSLQPNNANSYTLAFVLKNMTLEIVLDGVTQSLDIASLLPEPLQNNNRRLVGSMPVKDLVMENGRKLRVYIRSASFEQRGGGWELGSASGYLLIGPAP